MKYRTLLAFLFLAAGAATTAAGSPAPAGNTPSLIRDMAGTWQVQQRMWPGPNAQPLTLPAAVARRRLVGGFLQEDMRARSAKPGDSFTRIAYFNYNPVSQQYEYFSIDSRAPQMMNERSQPAADPAQLPGPQELSLDGSSFLAPRWGELSNTTFHYRLVVGAIENDRQLVRLYLTPQSAAAAEFLAFEYVYTRQR